jgi:hypothetical protein
MVRLTARCGWSASRVSAESTPSRRNSAYASSTTTTQPPGTSAAASSTSRTTSSSSEVPVGLFGLVSSTTEGCSAAISARACAGSTSNCSVRRPATQRVWVSRAYSGYIEYVGAKDSAVRPGPPKAWSTCSMTSFDPFAAHTCSGATRTPDSTAR